ncbi:hypothetical protein MK489_22365 [Myxococcota bacterium]|nr:hypothetical protein [Myxococcota bacterium]
MIEYSAAPTLLRDVIPDLGDVVGLLERNAPYTPLGGWYRPGEDQDAVTSPMWFQNDWVHADLAVDGSDLFMLHEEVAAAARGFYDAEVIIPRSLYVNIMAAIQESGPAHTDNPAFEGRNRSNTPMWLLRSMLWSGLFDRWNITQATSIWWMNDVEGGGIRYWPDGPDKPPQVHSDGMANTALVGDNHGMFHQVEPVGPFDEGTRRVSGRAELAPAGDGSGDWAVTDRGEIHYRAPLDHFRVSVLWKADVYKNDEERQQLQSEKLSFEDVVRIFNADLETKGADFRLDLAHIEDASHTGCLSEFYPESSPIEAGTSVYEAYA